MTTSGRYGGNTSLGLRDDWADRLIVAAAAERVGRFPEPDSPEEHLAHPVIEVEGSDSKPARSNSSRKRTILTKFGRVPKAARIRLIGNQAYQQARGPDSCAST